MFFPNAFSCMVSKYFLKSNLLNRIARNLTRNLISQIKIYHSIQVEILTMILIWQYGESLLNCQIKICKYCNIYLHLPNIMPAKYFTYTVFYNRIWRIFCQNKFPLNSPAIQHTSIIPTSITASYLVLISHISVSITQSGLYSHRDPVISVISHHHQYYYLQNQELVEDGSLPASHEYE